MCLLQTLYRMCCMYFHPLPPAELITRVITHPSFQNIGFEEVQKVLSGMEQGEAVFRPSSKVSPDTSQYPQLFPTPK